MSIGERIEARRRKIGISQTELARRVGVSQPTIHDLIKGRSHSSAHLHKIARELATTPAYLTGETDDPDSDTPDEPALTIEEAELLDLFRSLDKDERAAIITLARSSAGRARPPTSTVHSKGLGYRGQPATAGR